MVALGTFEPDPAGGDEELRIAPVMTGGSSLAVWMGGATAELYRVVRADVDEKVDDGMAVYRKLLEVTRRTARVDVITGTSAGGLNGSLLAAAIYLDIDAATFLKIGDTWLEVGDLEQLLWKNSTPNPPSLFQGDEYFQKKVADTIEGWKGEHDPPTRVPPLEIDLMTTLTTFTPEPRGRFDDYGEAINEVDHAQTLWFRPEQFQEEGWIERMAIASRTSASLPAIFEPSFIPVGQKDAELSGRPDFKDLASFRNSRWAVDGGVVVNLPLTEALDRIFDRYGAGEIKRVALYVSPTPSGFESPAADAFNAMPSIRDALVTTLLAPRAEGVAADLAAIHEHNLQVARQAESRKHLRPLVEQLISAGSESSSLYARYCDLRAKDSVESTLADAAARLGRLPMSYHEIQPALRRVRRRLLPESIADAGRSGTEAWAWGIAPVEQALSAAIRLTAMLLSALPPAATSGPSESRDTVMSAQMNLHHWRARTQEVRRLDGEYWKRQFETLAHEHPPLEAWAAVSYENWPGERRTKEEERELPDRRLHASSLRTWALAELRGSYEAVAQTLVRLSPVIEHLPSVSDNEIARDTIEEYRALTGAADSVERPATELRLRAIHVAQSLVLPNIVDREQPVTLMQMSWNARNGLDSRSAADKLAGPELGRLGAFMKPSWRANDWFWGRMDAADRLVLLLLDPARLRRLGVGAEDLEVQFPGLIDMEEAEDALHPKSKATAMPESAGKIATKIQTAIASTELVRVAEQVGESAEAGGDESASELWAEQVKGASSASGRVPDADVRRFLNDMKIGTETVQRELGSRLFTRVISRTTAVAVNALTGEHAKIPVLPRVLRPVRAPIHATNGLVSWLTQANGLARATLSAVLAVTGAIVALAIVGADVPSGSVAVSVLILSGAAVIAMLRIGFTAVAVAMVALAAVVGLTLLGEDLGSVVYSEPSSETETALGENSRIEVPAGTVIDITVDSGDATVDQDVVVENDASITIRDEAVKIEIDQGEEFVAAWKRYGFTNPASALRVLSLVALFLLLPRWVRESAKAGDAEEDDAARRERQKRNVLRGLGAIGLLLLAIFGPAASRALLTGAPESSTVKDFFVELADGFETYGLVVVLLAVVGVTMGLALIADWLPRLRRRLGPKTPGTSQ